MKINDVYEKHSRRLAAAAVAGRPFAALTYGPGCTHSHFRTFADKRAATAFLRAALQPGSGIDGVIAETDAARGGARAFYIPPVAGFHRYIS